MINLPVYEERVPLWRNQFRGYARVLRTRHDWHVYADDDESIYARISLVYTHLCIYASVGTYLLTIETTGNGIKIRMY